ncbi:hypothetical protein FKM82_014439 [Ascaphus truei]
MAGDEPGVTLGQPHLSRQDLLILNVTKLMPLSQEIISRQATINIGTIGHVVHGKSTVVRAISGVHTVRFKNKLERNITIKLGYANAKIYKLDDPSCSRPECYWSCGSSTPDKFPTDIPSTKGNFKLVSHVSFGDCPGHDILMATMLNGTVADGAPIIPISAQLKYNIEVVCEYIVKKIPVPLRDFTSEPRFIVIKSFDINKSECEFDDLKGDVAGGSILKGVLKVGQEIEVQPGIVSKDSEGKLICKPIFSKIVSFFVNTMTTTICCSGRPYLCWSFSAVKTDLGEIVLTNLCAQKLREKIAVSRRVEKH